MDDAQPPQPPQPLPENLQIENNQPNAAEPALQFDPTHLNHPNGDEILAYLKAARKAKIPQLKQYLKQFPNHVDEVVEQFAQGASALRLASGSNSLEAVSLLISHGADVRHGGIDGTTPLHSAAWSGHLPVVKYLVEKGAVVDALDSDRFSPLSNAARNGVANVVEYLLSKGANACTINANGSSILEMAEKMGHSNITSILIKHGAKPRLPSLPKTFNWSRPFTFGQIPKPRYLHGMTTIPIPLNPKLLTQTTQLSQFDPIPNYLIKQNKLDQHLGLSVNQTPESFSVGGHLVWSKPEPVTPTLFQYLLPQSQFESIVSKSYHNVPMSTSVNDSDHDSSDSYSNTENDSDEESSTPIAIPKPIPLTTKDAAIQAVSNLFNMESFKNSSTLFNELREKLISLYSDSYPVFRFIPKSRSVIPWDFAQKHSLYQSKWKDIISEWKSDTVFDRNYVNFELEKLISSTSSSFSSFQHSGSSSLNSNPTLDFFRQHHFFPDWKILIEGHPHPHGLLLRSFLLQDNQMMEMIRSQPQRLLTYGYCFSFPNASSPELTTVYSCDLNLTNNFLGNFSLFDEKLKLHPISQPQSTIAIDKYRVQHVSLSHSLVGTVRSNIPIIPTKDRRNYIRKARWSYCNSLGSSLGSRAEKAFQLLSSPVQVGADESDSWKLSVYDQIEKLQTISGIELFPPGVFNELRQKSSKAPFDENAKDTTDCNIPSLDQEGHLRYFECKVLNTGQCGYIAIGLVSKYHGAESQPGWERWSVGYHGDDGKCFVQSGLGGLFGPKYGVGDVVGCGLHIPTGSVFYTLNGKFLGVAHHNIWVATSAHSDSSKNAAHLLRQLENFRNNYVSFMESSPKPAEQLLIEVNQRAKNLWTRFGPHFNLPSDFKPLSGKETAEIFYTFPDLEDILPDVFPDLYPSVGLHSFGEEVEFNFGTDPNKPFLWNGMTQGLNWAGRAIATSFEREDLTNQNHTINRFNRLVSQKLVNQFRPKLDFLSSSGLAGSRSLQGTREQSSIHQDTQNDQQPGEETSTLNKPEPSGIFHSYAKQLPTIPGLPQLPMFAKKFDLPSLPTLSFNLPSLPTDDPDISRAYETVSTTFDSLLTNFRNFVVQQSIDSLRDGISTRDRLFQYTFGRPRGISEENIDSDRSEDSDETEGSGEENDHPSMLETPTNFEDTFFISGEDVLRDFSSSTLFKTGPCHLFTMRNPPGQQEKEWNPDDTTSVSTTVVLLHQVKLFQLTNAEIVAYQSLLAKQKRELFQSLCAPTLSMLENQRFEDLASQASSCLNSSDGTPVISSPRGIPDKFGPFVPYASSSKSHPKSHPKSNAKPKPSISNLTNSPLVLSSQSLSSPDSSFSSKTSQSSLSSINNSSPSSSSFTSNLMQRIQDVSQDDMSLFSTPKLKQYKRLVSDVFQVAQKMYWNHESDETEPISNFDIPNSQKYVWFSVKPIMRTWEEIEQSLPQIFLKTPIKNSKSVTGYKNPGLANNFSVLNNYAVCSVGGRFIYLHGGTYGSNDHAERSSSMYRFDWWTKSWEPVPYCDNDDSLSSTIPLPREHHSMVYCPNFFKNPTLVIFGGSDSSGPQLNDTRCFDLITRRWYQPPIVGPLPQPLRLHSAELISDHEMMVFGGWDGKQQSGAVEILDFQDWKWKKPRLSGVAPCLRNYTATSKVGNKVVTFGGFNGTVSLNSMEFLNFDPHIENISFKGFPKLYAKSLKSSTLVTNSTDFIPPTLVDTTTNALDPVVFQIVSKFKPFTQVGKPDFTFHLVHNNSVTTYQLHAALFYARSSFFAHLLNPGHDHYRAEYQTQFPIAQWTKTNKSLHFHVIPSTNDNLPFRFEIWCSGTVPSVFNAILQMIYTNTCSCSVDLIEAVLTDSTTMIPELTKTLSAYLVSARIDEIALAKQFSSHLEILQNSYFSDCVLESLDQTIQHNFHSFLVSDYSENIVSIFQKNSSPQGKVQLDLDESSLCTMIKYFYGNSIESLLSGGNIINILTASSKFDLVHLKQFVSSVIANSATVSTWKDLLCLGLSLDLPSIVHACARVSFGYSPSTINIDYPTNSSEDEENNLKGFLETVGPGVSQYIQRLLNKSSPTSSTQQSNPVPLYKPGSILCASNTLVDSPVEIYSRSLIEKHDDSLTLHGCYFLIWCLSQISICATAKSSDTMNKVLQTALFIASSSLHRIYREIDSLQFSISNPTKVQSGVCHFSGRSIGTGYKTDFVYSPGVFGLFCQVERLRKQKALNSNPFLSDSDDSDDSDDDL